MQEKKNMNWKENRNWISLRLPKKSSIDSINNRPQLKHDQIMPTQQIHNKLNQWSLSYHVRSAVDWTWLFQRCCCPYMSRCLRRNAAAVRSVVERCNHVCVYDAVTKYWRRNDSIGCLSLHWHHIHTITLTTPASRSLLIEWYWLIYKTTLWGVACSTWHPLYKGLV